MPREARGAGDFLGQRRRASSVEWSIAFGQCHASCRPARAVQKIAVENDFGARRETLRFRRDLVCETARHDDDDAGIGLRECFRARQARSHSACRHGPSDACRSAATRISGANWPCVTSVSNRRPAPHIATRLGARRAISAAIAVSAARLRARAEMYSVDQPLGFGHFARIGFGGAVTPLWICAPRSEDSRGPSDRVPTRCRSPPPSPCASACAPRNDRDACR